MKLIYTGNGAAWIGVPARDLSEQEVETLSKEFDIQKLIDSGLYRSETFDKADAEKVMPYVNPGFERGKTISGDVDVIKKKIKKEGE